MVSGVRKPQVLVCQHGARRRYAVARMLDQEGLLAALYTDSSSQSVLGRLAVALGDYAPTIVQRLAQRQVRGVAKEKVFSSDAVVVGEMIERLKGRKLAGVALFRLRHKLLSARMIHWGLQGADIVYAMYYENLPFLRWAKNRGACIVIDVFVNPLADLELDKEEKKYPFLSLCSVRSEKDKKIRSQMWSETVEIADFLLCPSEYVAEGVEIFSPLHKHKIRTVPYGCSIDYKGRKNSPTVGRILFVGGDPLRKGLHYLAEAIALLRHKRSDLEVRVAGAIPAAIMAHPLFKGIHFLGKLNSEQLASEFLAADVFVLPSLCEGFAGVVAEAVGAGCPVIVTPECGSPVEQGREGLIVPSKDIYALSSAISKLIGDRSFRDSCSIRCQEEIENYSETAWRQRLVHQINEIFISNALDRATPR